MSQNESGEWTSKGRFLVGFLAGVLVCVGIGIGWYIFIGRPSMMEAQMQRDRALREAVERERETKAVLDFVETRVFAVAKESRENDKGKEDKRKEKKNP